MQRRLAALLIGALAALAASVPPASGLTQPGAARAPTARTHPAARATTSPTTVGPAIPASAFDVRPASGSSTNAGGSGFSLVLSAGASQSQTLIVTNHSKDRFTIGVKPVDASRVDGMTRFSDRATDVGPGSWVAPTVSVGTVDPGQSASVPFTVTVPQDSPPGMTVVAGVVVAVQRADPLGAGVPIVDNLPSVSVPVAIGVAGTPAPVLAITRVKAKVVNGRTFLMVTVHNAGMVEAVGVGSVTATGGSMHQTLRVRVSRVSTRTVNVPWQAIDPALGADIDIELNYGQDNVASWVGTVAPDLKAKSTATTTPGSSGGSDGTTTTPVAGAHKSPWSTKKVLEIAAAIVAAFLLLGAIVFLLKELLGDPVMRAPIDIASMPPIEVNMDPRHTEVLNALVTQVGALGGAVERLADRVGMPVVVPPGPPLLTPGPKRRRRHSSPAHVSATDEPVVMQAPKPPPRVVAAAPASQAEREHNAIADAVQALPPLPIEPVDAPRSAPKFIAPKPVGDDVWPSDADVDAFMRRRAERDDD